jgi:peptidoglycan/xylan/chitin deacetylase (PgdA/CDA1 family)
MIRNFIFHKVVPQHKGGMLEMGLAHFEKCIRFIASKYTVVLLEDIEQHTKAGFREKAKPFATLTFDDGYRDNFNYALPVLDKYNCKGSFYIVTDCVEKNLPIWIHLVEYCFLETNNSFLSLQQPFLPKLLRISNTPAKGARREHYFSRLRTWLKHAPVDKKDEIVNYLLAAINDVEIPKQMMSWDDLAVLKSNGHYIGAHSHTHNALPFIADNDRLRQEFELPRQLIQKHLGHIPESFSYPFGFCNKRIKDMAEATGYTLGIAAERHQLYIEKKHNSFEIPRIALCNEPWWKTKLRITNKIENIKSLLPYKYKYRDL